MSRRSRSAFHPLLPAPERYNRKDQAEMRKSVEKALRTPPPADQLRMGVQIPPGTVLPPGTIKDITPFASGLTPVEIADVLPTTGNFIGRMVFLTTDTKLYRWDGAAWTTAVPAIDLTGTIDTDQIADLAITAGKLGALAVEAGKIAANAVTATEIAALAVTTAKIAAGAVTAAEIGALAVTTAKIAALAVGTSELAAGAVTTAKITALAVTAAEIAAGAITTAKINAGAVTAGEIGALAVTTAKLDALAVTAEKIAANTITAAKIAANTITAAQIAAGTITAAEIAALTITAAKIAALTITAAEIAALTITGAKIAAGTITADKLVANSITAGQILAGAIGTTELAASAVTAAKIAAGTISADKIIANSLTSGQTLGRNRGRLYRTTNKAIVTSNLTTIDWETTDFVVGSYGDLSQGLRIPSDGNTGVWLLIGQAEIEATFSGTLYLELTHSGGNPIGRARLTATSGVILQVTAVVDAPAVDAVFNLKVHHTHGSNRNIIGGSIYATSLSWQHLW